MRANRTLSRTNKKAAVKQAQLKMKEISHTINTLDKKCCKCSMKFDSENKSLLDSWMVQVLDGKASLYCPSCFSGKNLKDDAAPEQS
jgi:hypothetical protein